MWLRTIHSFTSQNCKNMSTFCKIMNFLVKRSQVLKVPLRSCSSDQKERSYKKMQISIEGNIGSGKSTLLESISNDPNIEIIQEPLHEWQNVKGGNILDLVYAKPERWSFLFQSYVLLSMLRIHHHQPQVKSIRLLERSVFSASYCFVENLYKSGHMSEVEYSVYSEWFQWMLDYERPHLDMIVYLRTSPEKCFERILQRSRHEEVNISMDLLNNIHKLHENWLVKKSSFPIPAPVMVIDGNKTLEDMCEYYKKQGQNIFRLRDKC